MTGTILFDLDGTLTDSQEGILAGYARALRALGHEPDPAHDMRPLIGPALEDVMAALLPRYGDDRVELAVTAYRDWYSREGLYINRVYDGIPALLAGLHGEGRRLFLATSKRVEQARTILAHFELSQFFSGIYGSEEGGAIDHKPELIAHILRREGIAAGDAVMVGDRSFDIAGAHANGLRAIGVLWGYGSLEELETAGADALAEDVGALRELL